MSLIVEKTGLMLGADGLYYAPGLGGAGLMIVQEEFDAVTFGGAGRLSASAIVVASASARLSGAASLSAHNT